MDAGDNKSPALPVVRFGVRELVVGSEFRPVDGWRLAGILQRERAKMGLDIHAGVLGEQAQRSDYQREISTVLRVTRPLAVVEVHGRADGLRTTPQGVIVEELKTSSLASTQLSGRDAEEAHSEQCGFYCAILKQNAVPVHGGTVLYYSLVDGGITRIALEHDAGYYLDLLLRRIDERLEARLEAARNRAALAALGTSLQFPHGEPRPIQREMMQHVREVVESGRVFFCSAPTGTGKTAAALFPAVKEALTDNRRLFFVTARLSQQTLALETAQSMAPEQTQLFAVQLQAKERSCPMPELRCVPGLCPYLSDFPRRFAESGLFAESWSHGAASGDSLTRRSVEEGLCPYEVSLALARKAALVICDQNYVFDPRYSLKSLLEESERGRPLLIVDEAHNVPERVRAAFSAELSLVQLGELSLETGGARDSWVQPTLFEAGPVDVLVRISRLFADIAESFERALRSFVEENEAAFFVEPAPREDIEGFAAELDGILPDAMAAFASGRWREFGTGHGRRSRRDPLLAVLFELQHFFRLALKRTDEFAVVWFVEGIVRVYCLEAAPFVRAELDRFHSAVLMSATLTPFEFFMGSMGVSASEGLCLELDSPFPRENRALVFVPGFDTRLQHRSQEAGRVARLMLDVMALCRGNYLAFFSSFSYRDEVVRLLPAQEVTVLVQSPAMKTEPLLAKLRANRGDRSLLLAAVHGGVFAEGVDFPGSLALGAFVVGPGIPAVSVERELIRAFFARMSSHEEGRLRAYVQPGMIRSIQAGGRVIRSETDRGFVIFLDDRFAEESFRSQMPACWRRELCETVDPVGLLGGFWGREAGRGEKGFSTER